MNKNILFPLKDQESMKWIVNLEKNHMKLDVREKPITPPHNLYFVGWSESYVEVVNITCNQDQLHISNPRDTASSGN